MPKTITRSSVRTANRGFTSSGIVAVPKRGNAPAPASDDRVRSRLVIPSGLESSEVVINGKPKAIEVALSVQDESK